MEELITSSGLIVVEIAVVLILVFLVVGVIFLRKHRKKEREAKNFVLKVNAGAEKRKERHLSFARNSMSDYLMGDDEIAERMEPVLEEHVQDVFEKENSLYREFIKVLMRQDGHSIDHFHECVDKLIQVCHLKWPKPSQNEEKGQAKDEAQQAQEEFVETLKNENKELREQINKLLTDNEKIMSEYEIIYEKHEALTKQRLA